MWVVSVNLWCGCCYSLIMLSARLPLKKPLCLTRLFPFLIFYTSCFTSFSDVWFLLTWCEELNVAQQIITPPQSNWKFNYYFTSCVSSCVVVKVMKLRKHLTVNVMTHSKQITYIFAICEILFTFNICLRVTNCKQAKVVVSLHSFCIRPILWQVL